jgi:uncharacterized repeat protein (TIGR01451 family)
MRKTSLIIRNLAIGVMLWATAGAALAAPIFLAPFNFTFNHPIGIDFQDITAPASACTDSAGCLIMSVNYFSGTPHNLDLVTSAGVPTQFSNLAGLTNELKIATVRASSCQGGFADGEVFTGNGQFGQVVRISPNGSSVINPWVNLGGTAIVRGSLFQDRFCAAGGDLIVVTGNEQTGHPANDNVGNVYRVKNNDPAPPSATHVATIGTHLEGVVTLPNNPAMHGPAAGKILAGAEEFLVLGRAPGTSADYNPDGGAIYVIDPAGSDVWFTISNGHASAPPCTLDVNGQATPNHCNFHTDTAFHPEDLDLIRRNSRFFGVAFSEDHVLTTVDPVTGAPAFNQFDDMCGQVLVTQELPFAGTSGLSSLSWTGSAFVITPILSNRDGQIFQWEHVTFTNGDDCATTLSIVKTPKNATFNIGDQLTFTLVVTNTGHDTAVNAVLDDPLPTTGGLTWSVDSTSAGVSCNPIPASQVLHCNLGNMAPGAQATVVVKSSNANGAPAASCTGQKLNNIGTASAFNAPAVTDHGDYTCQPGNYTLTKNPKGASYNIGDNISFTMVVTSTGPGLANNVVLNDPLPTLGNLNSWTITANPGNACSIGAGNTLNCPFGNLANGQTRAVTVATNVAGGADATACTGAKLNNTATLTGTGLPTKTDTGDYTCKPGNYTLTKNPKGATYHIGDNINFTMVVTSTGPGTANHVVLNDPLPTLGNLNTWTITTNPGGVCTIVANTLNCSFGNLANGQTRTVVVATNAAGGADATACTGATLNNTATLTATGLPTKTDTGDYTCTPTTGKSIEIGPSSMEGAIKIDIGDWVNGGYSFKTNFTGPITITATVSITGPCTGGTLTSDTLIVPLGTISYSAVSGADWLPTGDANSVLSWQGSIQAPATLCGGGQLNASKGAVFDATVSGVPAGKAITFRFKFRDPAAKGKPNTNCLDTSDPNRAKADVCGASWSSTKTDP